MYAKYLNLKNTFCLVFESKHVPCMAHVLRVDHHWCR